MSAVSKDETTTSILDQLERFGISKIGHSGSGLVDHLVGTYEITKAWGSPEYVCFGALCHSIYGTESFSKKPATLDNREFMRKTLGEKAERLAYLFGAHVKNSLWENLSREENFQIRDRFENTSVEISRDEFCDLLTITLANWLEQRPREAAEFQNARKDEFLRSRAFLSEKAYFHFIEAYGL